MHAQRSYVTVGLPPIRNPHRSRRRPILSESIATLAIFKVYGIDMRRSRRLDDCDLYADEGDPISTVRLERDLSAE